MYTLEPLPYPYDALEPNIDAETMRVHHDKHHQAYTDNLNKTLAGHEALAQKPAEDLLKDLDAIPEAIRMAIRNHGGGYVNHSFFWPLLKKNNGQKPAGKLSEAIVAHFGSFDSFKEQFAQAAMGQFGSGWAWFTAEPNGKLEVMHLPNQDSPLSSGKTPLLTLDVWEHAYYLTYQNRRAEYVSAFWNVVNWEKVAELFGKI